MMSHAEVLAALKTTPVLILLDGFDEVAASTNPALQQFIADILCDPRRRGHAEDGVVVTSRVERAPALLKGRNLSQYAAMSLVILPWDTEQVKAFATKYLATLLAAASEEESKKTTVLVERGVRFVVDAQKRPGMGGLANVPLMFDILCCIAADRILGAADNDVDSNTAADDTEACSKPHSVIGRAVEMLLQRAQRKGGVFSSQKFTEERAALLDYLETEAWSMMVDQGRKTLRSNLPEVNRLLERCELVEGLREVGHKTLLRKASQISQRRPGATLDHSSPSTTTISYRFVHTMFFDFFAAKYIISSIKNCKSYNLAADVSLLVARRQRAAIVLAASMASEEEEEGNTVCGIQISSVLRSMLDAAAFAQDEEDMNDTFLVPLFAEASLLLDNTSMLQDTWVKLRAPLADFSASSACQHCSSPFTFTRHRHHCHRCGRVFCSKCSSSSTKSTQRRRQEGSVDLKRLCTACAEGFTEDQVHDSALLLLKHLGKCGHLAGVKALLPVLVESKYAQHMQYEPPDTIAPSSSSPHDEDEDGWDAPTMRPRLIREVYRCASRAASSGFVDIISFIINFTQQQEQGMLSALELSKPLGRLMPPIASAASNGHCEVVRYLHEVAHFSLRAPRALDNRNPLHLAAGAGHVDVVEVILKSISKENKKKKMGTAEPSSPLTIDCEDCSGLQPIHLAAECGRIKMIEILLQNGADINARSRVGTTPLHLAGECGRLEAVQHLIENYGADCAAVNANERTVLHFAAEEGQVDVVRYLIRQRPTTAPTREEGSAAATTTTTLVELQDKFGWTALHVAARGGNVAVVECLHKDGGADCAAQGHQGQTPMHLAAMQGHLDVVKYLHLQGGASCGAESNDGSTPLEWAEDDDQDAVVEYLSEHSS